MNKEVAVLTAQNQSVPTSPQFRHWRRTDSDSSSDDDSSDDSSSGSSSNMNRGGQVKLATTPVTYKLVSSTPDDNRKLVKDIHNLTIEYHSSGSTETSSLSSHFDGDSDFDDDDDDESHTDDASDDVDMGRRSFKLNPMGGVKPVYVGKMLSFGYAESV